MKNAPRSVLTWAIFLTAILIPFIIAAQSPFLEFRQPVYIIAGFAGIFGLALLLVQPLLIQGTLPGLSRLSSRRLHRWTGVALFLAVVVHVAGLWVTSPPDVIDVLLLRSPSRFSIWAVVAMWAVFAATLYAALRKPLRLRPELWRRVHLGLAVIITVSTVVHAVLIEGTMGQVSKVVLCSLVIIALARVFWDQIR